MMHRLRSVWHFAILALSGFLLSEGLSSSARGAAYASGVSINGTTVSFILNEPAEQLSITLNGTSTITLDGSTSGVKTFNLGSASDTFAITASTNDPIGYTIPTGGTIAAVGTGLSQASNAGGFMLISDDANPLVRFNSPRGVTVATDPNNSQFGTAYISNSAAGTTSGVVRAVGDGLYGLKADQSDAFGNGNTAVPTGFEGTASTSSPFRLSVGGDHNVYIADFSDANGGVYRMSNTLSGGTQVLAGIGGPSTVPAGQNHGSTTAVFVSGTAAGTTLYTLDEDLTSSNVVPGGSTTDKNSLWKYDIGTATQYAGSPSKVNSGAALVPLATSDLDVGLNGDFYLGQNRSAGNEAGVTVLSPDGALLFDSLTASRTLLGNPAAVDILRNIVAIAVSPDQKYLAGLINNSVVVVLPLINGIPDLANRLVIDTGTDIISGRDIAFDAADNIHYVSSGQALYRVLAPGGFTSATTSWNGSNYDFVLVPEPSSALLLGAGVLLLARRRRR